MWLQMVSGSSRSICLTMVLVQRIEGERKDYKRTEVVAVSSIHDLVRKLLSTKVFYLKRTL